MFLLARWLAFLAAVQAESCEPSCASASDALQASLSFLQKQQSLELRTNQMECGGLINGSAGNFETFFNNNCKYHSHGDECSRPIPEIMAEHPGMDGYCYFSEVAMYISYNPPSREPRARVRDALQGCLSLRAPSNYQGLNTGPLVTYHFDGKAIQTHIDSSNYVYDDLYGYSLGLLQGQGRTAEQVLDPALWEDLARSKCEELQQKYQFTNDELVLEDILDMNMPIMAMAACTAGWELPITMRVPYVTERAEYHSPTDCKKITDREFARHHYMKCLMGANNAADDAAYLFARACLLDNGTRIGHFSECPLDLEKEGVI